MREGQNRDKMGRLAVSSPEQFLRLALDAGSAQLRARYARQGLAAVPEDLSPDTQVLLLRQLYLAKLEAQEFQKAAEIAQQAAQVGPLRDIAHHDAARALAAAGDLKAAAAEQKKAAEAAPSVRRSFHLWSLATLLAFLGDFDGALDVFDQAEDYADRDLPLIRAHRALVALEAGRAVQGLSEIREQLQHAKCREGYGRYVLGMIAFELGDRAQASIHLRAFLNRNAAADKAKTLTLREEFRRARAALASFESH